MNIDRIGEKFKATQPIISASHQMAKHRWLNIILLNERHKHILTLSLVYQYCEWRSNSKPSSWKSGQLYPTWSVPLLSVQGVKGMSQYKDVFSGKDISIRKIRRSRDRLIFMMEIHMLVLRQAPGRKVVWLEYSGFIITRINFWTGAIFPCLCTDIIYSIWYWNWLGFGPRQV